MMRLQTALFKKEPLFFFGLLLVSISAICWFPYGLTTDGTTHAANARYIVDLLTGRCPLTARVYEFNPRLLPNWSGHAIMAALIYLGATIPQAGKITFALCIAVFAIGFRALANLHQKNDPRSWLGLVLAFNPMLTFSGIYNFCLGFGIFMFAVAYYFNTIDLKRPWRFCLAFMVLLLAAWFSHLLDFLFIGAVIFIYEAIAFTQSRPKAWLSPQAYRNWFQTKWPLVFACLPCLILTAVYLSYDFQPYHFYNTTSHLYTFLLYIFSFLFMSDFYGVGPQTIRLIVFYSAISIPCLMLLYEKRHLIPNDRIGLSFLLGGLTFWLMGMLMPQSALGGWMIGPRFDTAGWCLVLMAAMRLDWSRFHRQAFVGLSVLLLLGQLGIYAFKAANLEAVLSAAMAQAPQPQANSLIYTMNVTPALAKKHRDLFFEDDTAHFGSFGFIWGDRTSCTVEMANYEAAHDYFPLRFKNNLFIQPIWGIPYHEKNLNQDILATIPYEDFDPPAFTKQTSVPVDYLISWGDKKTLDHQMKLQVPLALSLYQKNFPMMEKNFDVLTKRDYRSIYDKPQVPVEIFKKDYRR